MTTDLSWLLYQSAAIRDWVAQIGKIIVAKCSSCSNFQRERLAVRPPVGRL